MSRHKDDRAKVLLVDDRVDKLLALETVLLDLGSEIEIVKANSGEEALRALLRDEYAVIILDVNMPGMDGFETASLIRQRKSFEHTPIIFVTGINTTDTHVSRGYSLGAVDYIFSPVEPVMLRAKVAVFIDLYQKSQKLQKQEAMLRMEAERRLVTLETRLQVLLNRLNVGVFRFSQDGELIEANRAFMRIIGINDLSQARNLDLELLYTGGFEGQSVGVSGDDSEQAPSQGMDLLLKRLDGKEIWVSLSKTRITGDDGMTYTDGLIEDISVRKEAEEVLIRKSEELARSNADLEQFAFIASHDLQEPLRIISSYSSLVSKRYGKLLDKDANEYLTGMLRSTERMYVLINDLLTYSRANSQAAKQGLVNCSEVIERALFSLRAAIEESGASITTDELPQVYADQVMVGQLFQNLIGNAIKFRGEKAPVIHVSAKLIGDLWELSVADNGIGIPEKHCESIFGVFKRLHRRDEYPGTGIGLALCRKVVERHGGRIWVESILGQGSTFKFTLPAQIEGDSVEIPPSDGQAQAGSIETLGFQTHTR